jgi:hypothetical protein
LDKPISIPSRVSHPPPHFRLLAASEEGTIGFAPGFFYQSHSHHSDGKLKFILQCLSAYRSDPL